MEHHKELLHVRFAEEVMGWSDVEPSREGGSMKFYGTVHTNRGPQRREVPHYSNDLAAMWGAEQYLKSLGLTEAYLAALRDVVGAADLAAMWGAEQYLKSLDLTEAYLAALKDVVGAADLATPEDLFRMVNASPAQRCEAALNAYRAGGLKR